MAVLNIRNLPDDVHAALRVRAAKAGHSMEAEARRILTDACKQGQERRSAANLQELVDELYSAGKPEGVVDDLFAERRREAGNE